MSTLSSLLDQLGLEQYAAAFADNGVDLDALLLLSDRDLQDLGVLLGHRRKLLRAIAEINGDKQLVPAAQAAAASMATGEQLGSAAERRQLTVMAAIVRLVTALAKQSPVLMVVEDAHWIDPTTQEMLDLLVSRLIGARVLLLITYRPEYVPPWSQRLGHVTAVQVSRLSRRQALALVARVTGERPLPEAILDQIVAKTDGVPLFIEELTKTVLEAGFLTLRDGVYTLDGPLPPLAIPSTLQDSLMARLDRLSRVKEVAQIGACIGREFSHELLAAVSPMGAKELVAALEQLITSELIHRSGTQRAASYTFKHALVRDAAYNSLLKSRRQALHGAIAQSLSNAGQGAGANDLIARHYAFAGLDAEALPYWLEAGRHSWRQSSYVEGISQLTTGLEALARLPEGHPARKLELGFLLLLGPLYGAVEGESSTQAMAVYERALELADATEEPRTRFKIWDGAWRVFGNRSDLERAQDATRHMVAYAETTDDSAYRLHALNAVGTLCLYQGRHEDAVRYSEEALTYSNPERDRTLAFEVGRDPVANAFLNVAFCSMALGFVDRAQRAAHSAVHAARESRHPYTLTATLIYAGADTAHFVGNTLACRSFAEEGLSVARRYGFVQAGTLAALYMAWADTWTMPSLENAEALSAAFDDYRRTKAKIRLTRLSAVVADAYRRAGRPEAGLAIVEPWLRGERITHSEAPRVAGELRLAIDARDHKTAEELFGCALRVAREEGARYLELRAAASLARLWEKQGRRKEAYDLLAPIYNWFTEGFDTKDLKEAKVLLEELAA